MDKVSIQKMTDAELVEAVAREVMGWEDIVHYGVNRLGILRTGIDEILNGCWEPFTDMNDLLMVLERFEGWELSYSVTMSRDGHKMYWCVIFDNKGGLAGVAHNIDKARAVLEACLTAERG